MQIRFKEKITRAVRWLFHLFIEAFATANAVLKRLPSQIRERLFRLGAWGKKQLDKRINAFQRERLHTIVFKTETIEGRRFDRILTVIILFSIVVVMLETVSEFHRTYWWIFFVLEWLFTVLFTIEYILRLYCARFPLRYATSFFGIVDLLSIIPSYLAVFFVGAQHLLVVRALRLLRVFRIFKMGHFVSEGEIIINALRSSRTKISLFLTFIVLMALIIGSILYIVEGGINPHLDNIPKGIYWAIVTLTTVGYGDVTPMTAVGKFLATVVMVMGYAVIAVPTGIITAEITSHIFNKKEGRQRECPTCEQAEHPLGAVYCFRCGTRLSKEYQTEEEEII